MDENEFAMVDSILKLFAKIIKQDASQYPFLNKMYLQFCEKDHDKALAHYFMRGARGVRTSNRAMPYNNL